MSYEDDRQNLRAAREGQGLKVKWWRKEPVMEAENPKRIRHQRSVESVLLYLNMATVIKLPSVKPRLGDSPNRFTSS